MSEEIPVVIDLTSKVVGRDAGEETTSNQVEGQLISKENATYIRYNEDIADTGRVRNVVKVTESDVTIIRNGAVSMNQQFLQGETTTGDYGTSFGTLHMETTTRQLHVEKNHDGEISALHLAYQLQLQGRDVGQVTLGFYIKEAGEQ